MSEEDRKKKKDNRKHSHRARYFLLGNLFFKKRSLSSSKGKQERDVSLPPIIHFFPKNRDVFIIRIRRQPSVAWSIFLRGVDGV